MPIVNPSNNRILPANTRAVDVATGALRDVADIQQRRYDNAFQVMGYSTLHYSWLEAGIPCSCKAQGNALATRLNKDGKLDKGTINKLITGYEFKVTPYKTQRTDLPNWRADQGEPDPVRPDLLIQNQTSNNQIQSPFDDRVARDNQDPAARWIEPNGDAFGVNGPIQSADTIADLEETPFDADFSGLTDISCPICLGTGFIGAASLTGGWRKILVPQETNFIYTGEIDTTERPLLIKNCTTASYPNLVIPSGVWALDALRVWNGFKIVPATIMVDSVPINIERDFLQFCDGNQHTLQLVFSTPVQFTHVEIQAAVSQIPVRIEFPRLTQNSDLTKLDPTDDVQIFASPSLPSIRRRDLLVESTFGKVFQVTNVTWFNDTQRRIHGWDMSARVVQPQELFNALPRRSVQKQKPTKMVRDNVSGTHRT